MRPICYLIVLCLSFASFPAEGAEPRKTSEIYLRAHQIMLEGMKMLEKQDFSGAYYKFQDAQEIFDSVFRSDPNWQPDMVDWRRKKVAEMKESARQQEIQRRHRVAKDPQTLNPTPIEPGIKGSDDPKPDSVPPQPKPAPFQSPSPINLPKAPQPRQVDEVLKAQVAELQHRIRVLETKNEEHLKVIGGKEEALQQAGEKIHKYQRLEKKHLEEMHVIKTKLDIEVNKKSSDQSALYAQIKALTEQRDKYEAQLKNSMTQVAELNQKNLDLIAEVRKAYADIKQLNEEKAKLSFEREQFSNLLQGDANKADKIRGLANENDKLRKFLVEMQLRIDTLKKQNEAQKLASQEQRNQFQENQEADRKLIADLQAQLDTARSELSRLKQENQDYQQQLESFSKRLEETELALAQTSSEPKQESHLLEENRILRDTILNIIKQQAGRESAKESIVEELHKTKSLSNVILDQLNGLTTPIRLPKETRDLLKPGDVPIVITSDGVNAQLPIRIEDNSEPPLPGRNAPTQTPPADPPPTDIRAHATVAQQYFQKNQFDDAERQYDKILTLDPMNFSARCNLAVSQLRQKKLDLAAQNLKKVLAYKYDHDFSHYLLGVIFMEQGKLTDATEAATKSLEINDQNPNSHFLMGVISVKQKKLAAAEKEFLRTLQLDQDHGDAHYNLAIIYATSENPKMSTAKEHYHKATKLGVPRDSNLERLL